MSRRGTLVRQRKKPLTIQTAARANRPARFANVRLPCEWPSSPTFTGISMRSSRCFAAERAAVCLIGNHALGVLGRIDLEDFSPDAAAAARWTADVLEDEPRRYLESLSPEATLEGAALFHASPRDPVWEYVLAPEVAFLS